jgi:DNA-binding CsgD family transcriptional regulator
MHDDELDALSAGVRTALQQLSVPSYILDSSYRIRWLNEAAHELFGDAVGHYGAFVVAPEHRARARELFLSKLLGAGVTNFDVNLVRSDGCRLMAQISSVRLMQAETVLGVFGVITSVRPAAAAALPLGVDLTPRQHEVLVLLAEGLSSEQIANRLELSVDTVRNHVREILRRLGVHSRIAAVATARRLGLL